MKKTFNCGHKGMGKFCHRCQQAVQALDRSKALAKSEPSKAEALAQKSKALFAVPTKSTMGAVVAPS